MKGASVGDSAGRFPPRPQMEARRARRAGTADAGAAAGARKATISGPDPLALPLLVLGPSIADELPWRFSDWLALCASSRSVVTLAIDERRDRGAL